MLDREDMRRMSWNLKQYMCLIDYFTGMLNTCLRSTMSMS